MDYLGESAPQSFLQDITHMRYDLVFIFPPWKAIHISDNERYESFEQGQKIHQHILSRYQNLNHDPIEVPTGSVNDRIEFILKFLRS
jgi:predicted ATPase